jgi:hypothetical protein
LEPDVKVPETDMGPFLLFVMADIALDATLR